MNFIFFTNIQNIKKKKGFPVFHEPEFCKAFGLWGIALKTSQFTFFFEGWGWVVYLFGDYPTREFFTHMETSLFSVKGCKFGPFLGNSDCHTGNPFIMVISEDP